MEHCVKTGERLVLTPVLITQEVAKRAHKYGWISTLAYNQLIHNKENRYRAANPIVSNVSNIFKDDDASTWRTNFNNDNFKENKMPSNCNSVDRKCKKDKAGEETHSNPLSSPMQAQKDKQLKKAVNNEMDNKKETCLDQESNDQGILADEESIFLRGSFINKDSTSIVSGRKRFQTHATDIVGEQIEDILEQNLKTAPSGESVCSTDEAFNNCCNELTNYLVKCGYKRDFICKQIKHAADIPGITALRPSIKCNKCNHVPFVLTYNPALPNIIKIIQTNFNLLLSSKRCKNAFKDCPIIAFRRTGNLCDILVKAKLSTSVNYSTPLPPVSCRCR